MLTDSRLQKFFRRTLKNRYFKKSRAAENHKSFFACASGKKFAHGFNARRADFERVGGFPPLRLLEDVFLSRALRRLGRVVVSRRRVYVSPRRWRQAGLVRQTLRNWALTALAALGVHPDRLAPLYPAVR